TEVTDLVKERRRNRRQRRLLQSILKLVPIIIDCKNSNGCYTLANQAFLDFVGHGFLKDVQGRKVADLLPSEQAEAVGAADRTILTGEAQAQIEVTLPDKEGRARVFQITKLPLENDGKGIIGILSVARDVTDEKDKIERTEDRSGRIAEFAKVGIFDADA